MLSRIWLAAAAAMVVCAGAAAAAPPIEAYGRLPSVDSVVLSPDGNAIAYVKSTDAKRAIVIQAFGQPPIILDAGAKKVRWLQWASPRHVIITVSETTVPRGLGGEREEYFTAQSFDMQSKTLHPLLDHIKNLNTSKGAMNIIAGQPMPRMVDGKPVVFVPGYYFPSTYGEVGLFRIDLDTGESRLVSREGRSDVDDWLLDSAGNILAEQGNTRFTQHWKLTLYRNGQPDKTIMDVPAPIEGPGIAGLSDDGTAVIIAMPPTAEGRTYKQVSLKDGAIAPWRPDLAHLGGVFSDDETGKVIGATHIVDKTDYVFFDAQIDAMWKIGKASFASATNVSLDSWSDDKTKAVLHVFDPKLGEGFFILDMTAKKAFAVAAAYDGINEFYEVKWIEYQAGDGRKLHAYLTLPKGEAKNLPLIVFPHGGPHARDEAGFDWWQQAMASRGYAVLQPQFRGSGGFGRELLEAGFGQFGKKMQTDLSDGVRALAAQGVIDPKRVCIVGASYGGYAALAGPTLDPGVYRCAVSVAGLSDLRAFMSVWPRPKMGAEGTRFWERFLDVADGSHAKLDAVSPIKHIDQVTVPILLIHGRDDTVVPFAQTQDMVDALKSAKKPCEFVIMEHEDHWLSTGATRRQMLEATIKFLEANNPPHLMNVGTVSEGGAAAH